MKSIPINDIKPPIRITVTSREQMLKILRGAHHFRDAFEITFDGMGWIYYVCAMDHLNEGIRKMVLSRAAAILVKNTPANFNNLIEDNPEIPAHIIRGLPDNSVIVGRQLSLFRG